MFLRLTSVVAAVRALAALAVVTASMSGHAAAGHHHVDLSRAALAFLMLLAAAWGTNNPRVLVIAALCTQALVHGGIPSQGSAMVLVHALGALAALVLTARFESLWAACCAAFAPLLRVVGGMVREVPPVRGALRPVAWTNPFTSHIHSTAAPRRGPPVFA